MNLPNKLTITRIFLTFVFVLLLFSGGLAARVAAFIIFLTASLTDLYDGYLARKYNMITDFGKLMDPIADKILLLSAFFAFIELRLVPAWMVILMVLREFIVTGLRLLSLTKGKVLAAQRGGKHKTVSQMVAVFIALGFLIIKEMRMKLPGGWTAQDEVFFKDILYIVMLITTALTLISGAAFLYKNKNLFANNNE